MQDIWNQAARIANRAGVSTSRAQRAYSIAGRYGRNVAKINPGIDEGTRLRREANTLAQMSLRGGTKTSARKINQMDKEGKRIYNEAFTKQYTRDEYMGNASTAAKGNGNG